MLVPTLTIFSPSYVDGIKHKFFDTNARLEGIFDPNDGVSLLYSTYMEQVYVNFIGASLYETSSGHISVNQKRTNLYAINNLKENYNKNFWTIEPSFLSDMSFFTILTEKKI